MNHRLGESVCAYPSFPTEAIIIREARQKKSLITGECDPGGCRSRSDREQEAYQTPKVNLKEKELREVNVEDREVRPANESRTKSASKERRNDRMKGDKVIKKKKDANTPPHERLQPS